MIRKVMLGLIILAGLPAASAEARLVGRRAEGVNRVCIYQVMAAGRSRNVRAVERRVGLGEPCPPFDPGETPRDAPRIPSNAVLIDEQVSSSLRNCIYRQAGIRYSRAIPRTLRCPLTPIFAD